MRVDLLFTSIKHLLLDSNGNELSPELLAGHYNDTIDEILPVLMVLGAPVAMTRTTITGDGTSQTFALPSDFRAPALGRMLPRSPRDAAADYTYGTALEQVDEVSPRIKQASTEVRDPGIFCLYVAGAEQRVRFDAIPPTGYLFDFGYYPTPTPLAVGAEDSTVTPWLGLLDPLIKATIQLKARAGQEFVGEARELWRQRAMADAVTLLGLRKLDDRRLAPSLFKGFSWHS
jgi:hypothetical protein